MPLPDPVPSPPEGYVDAVGGQPILPAARVAWAAAADQAWSDPARLHPEGRRAGLVLDAARASIATHLGVPAQCVYFTSSGPTAVQLAIQGLLTRSGVKSRTAVVSAAETMAVQQPAQRLAEHITVVPIDAMARIDTRAFADAVAHRPAVACLQAANPEVGTRQPIDTAARICREAGVPLLVHAVQVLGRDGVPAHWDVLAASARDWGGPAGVGILAVRPDVNWQPDQSPDRGWVAGFPDVPGAAAAATAWDYLEPHREDESARARAQIDRLRSELPIEISGLQLVGDPSDRLPHILTVVIDDVVGEQVVHELATRGVSAASGSACTSDARMPSAVLAAMGLPDRSSVRISLPIGCTDATIDRVINALQGAVAEART